MKVREVMCKKVVTVSPDTSIKELSAIVFKKKLQAVPVVDKEGKMLGIVAESDILSKLYPTQKDFVEDFVEASDFEGMEEKLMGVMKLKAKDLMNKAAICTYPDAPLLKAASKMMVKRVGRLPVIDPETEELLGVISKGDVIRAIIKFHKQPLEKLIGKAELKD
jgi:CBS domain-containing protein